MIRLRRIAIEAAAMTAIFGLVLALVMLAITASNAFLDWPRLTGTQDQALLAAFIAVFITGAIAAYHDMRSETEPAAGTPPGRPAGAGVAGRCLRVGDGALRQGLAQAVGLHLPKWSGRLSPRGLRHFCASRLYEQGMDLKAIQEFLGHDWPSCCPRSGSGTTLKLAIVRGAAGPEGTRG